MYKHPHTTTFEEITDKFMCGHKQFTIKCWREKRFMFEPEVIKNPAGIKLHSPPHHLFRYFNAEPGSPAWGEVLGRDRLNAPKDGRFDLFSRELFSLDRVRKAGDEFCMPHFELPTNLRSSQAKSLQFPYMLITQTPISQTPAWQGIIPTLQECYGLQGNVRWSSWLEINPSSAEALELKDGDMVWVESEHGRVQAPVRLYPGIWPNAVFMPYGQGHLTRTRWGRNSPDRFVVGANPNQLLQSSSERLSGQAVTYPVQVRIYKVE